MTCMICLFQRKHERQDHDQNYRRYRLAQTMLGIHDSHPALNPLLHEALRPMGNMAPGSSMAPPLNPEIRNEESTSPTITQSIGAPPPSGLQRPPPFLMSGFPPPNVMDPNHPLARFLGAIPSMSQAPQNVFTGGSVTSSASTPTTSSGPSSPVDLSTVTEDKNWERFMCYVGREDPCSCEASGSDHWHCEACDLSLNSREAAKDHGRVHEHLAIVTEDQYIRVMPGDDPKPCQPDCPYQDRTEHFHCRVVSFHSLLLNIISPKSENSH